MSENTCVKLSHNSTNFAKIRWGKNLELKPTNRFNDKINSMRRTRGTNTMTKGGREKTKAIKQVANKLQLPADEHSQSQEIL